VSHPSIVALSARFVGFHGRRRPSDVLSAIASRDLCEGDASPFNDFRDRIVTGGVVWRDGHGVLSDAPGLGVTVDEDAVRAAPASGRAGGYSA
jgi:hypothetical protein